MVLNFVVVEDLNAISDSYLGGFRAYKDQDYDLAIENFKRAIVENPENFMAYWWLANIYMEKRLYKKAKNIVSIADNIKLKPPKISPEIFDDRRRIVGDEREYFRRKKESEQIFSKAKKTVETGNWQKSIELISEAIIVNPLDYRYYNFKGDILFDMNEISDARIMYLKAALLSPKKDKILKKLADTEEKLGLNKEYIGTLKKIYDINGNKDVLKKIQNLSYKQLERTSYKILKRMGNQVFVDLGLKNGLEYGDEIKTKLRIVHVDQNNIIKDINTDTAIAWENEISVGEVMITRIEKNYSEGLVIKEYNGGIRVGDEILWQMKTKR